MDNPAESNSESRPPRTVRLETLARVIVILLLPTLFIFVASSTRFLEFSVFGDLKLGQWIEKRWEIPQTDPFAAAVIQTRDSGELPPLRQPWLHALTTWWVYTQLGWHGPHAGLAVAWVLGVFSMGWAFWRFGLRWERLSLAVLLSSTVVTLQTQPGPEQWVPMTLGLIMVGLSRIQRPGWEGLGALLVGFLLWTALVGSAAAPWIFIMIVLGCSTIRQAKPAWKLAWAATLGWVAAIVLLSPGSSTSAWDLFRSVPWAARTASVLVALCLLVLIRHQPELRRLAPLLLSSMGLVLIGQFPGSALAPIVGLLTLGLMPSRTSSPSVWWKGAGLAVMTGICFFSLSASRRGDLGYGPQPGQFPETAAIALGQMTGGGVLLHDARDTQYLLWRLWPDWVMVPLSTLGDDPQALQRGLQGSRVALIRHDSPWSIRLADALARDRAESSGTPTRIHAGLHRPVLLDDLGWMTIRQDGTQPLSPTPFRALIPGLPWDRQTQLLRSTRDWMDLGGDIRSLTLDQPQGIWVNQYLRAFQKAAPAEARLP